MFRILYRFLASLARLAVSSGRSKDLEIIVLRHQLNVLRRQVDRPAVTDDVRTLLGAIAAALPRRIRGELARLGHTISKTTVGQILTANPTGACPTQAARNLFIAHGDRLEAAQALVCDRGSQFIDSFDEIFKTEGMKVLKTPVRTPVANTFAERWIGSIRLELLDQQPPTPIDEPPETPPATLAVLRTSRCDGLIHEYRNAA